MEEAVKSGSTDFTNRLIDESSPYLLQHAHNPVDWHPWGDEASSKAVKENKLIFLSIGYSTCHWCHVMEHESFEDEEVAELMNRAYVSIKVDREVRPDLDAVFMETAMMMNRRGGWPLNLILTPDGNPFYAATYIPKTGNSNTAGMMELLPRIEQMWKEEPEKLTDAAEQIVRALKAGNTEAQNVPNPVFEASGPDSIRAAAAGMLEQAYDETFGGFGSRPKFPQPQNILLLLRRYHETGDAGTLEMAETTLQNMRSGGIYDHIGFGFHRYSTDQQWLLPHFEKMLYDQAMLITAYTEAFQVTGNPEYRRSAEEIIEYVLRDMRSPEGGFYSAEDADSDGREGKFYVWEYAEFENLLERDGFNPDIWSNYFNLQQAGNFKDEASGIKTGENILYTSPGRSTPSGLDTLRRLLFKEREKRVRPHKDDKILTDWNGLMVFALAKAAWSFNEPAYLDAAEAAADFILGEMKQPDGSLLHSYRQGRADTLGMIDDYAFLTRGLLELYRAGFNPEHIIEAIALSAHAQKRFEDTAGGGFYQADARQTDLLIRKKSLMDNAVPSGNSLMYENLMQLFKITGETAWRDSAEGILKTAGDELGKYPSALAMLLSSFDYAGNSGREIIIAGETEAAAEMVSTVNSIFMPGTVVLVKSAETEKALFELASYTQYYPVPEDQKTAVYVCTEFTCSRPVYDTEALRELLEIE